MTSRLASLGGRLVSSPALAPTSFTSSALSTALQQIRPYSDKAPESGSSDARASSSGSPAEGSETASTSQENPQRALFDKIRSNPHLRKFTFDATAEPAAEKFNYNKPGTHGQQPIVETSEAMQDIGPVTEEHLREMLGPEGAPSPSLFLQLQRALLEQDRGDQATQGVLRKLAQVQLDNMSREGLIPKDDAAGQPVKTPGVTRTMWGADPARHTLWFQFDCTMGRIPNILRNAYLSEEAKDRIFRLHAQDPLINNHHALAEQFNIRPERVAAIVTLREMEARCRAKGVPLDEAWQGEMENEERASGQQFYSEGTGERHWEWLPTDPATDKGLTWDEYMKKCEKVSSDSAKLNYEEFMERLRFNLCETAPSVTRGAQRFQGFPKKPAQGYDLVVEPIAKRKEFTPFAVSPAAAPRPLSEDEAVYLRRKLTGFTRGTNRLAFQGFDNAPTRAVLAREAKQRWRQKHGKYKH